MKIAFFRFSLIYVYAAGKLLQLTAISYVLTFKVIRNYSWRVEVKEEPSLCAGEVEKCAQL